MRTVRILEEASQEAMEAAAWYEYEEPGLGAEFFATIEAAIDVIEENLIPFFPGALFLLSTLRSRQWFDASNIIFKRLSSQPQINRELCIQPKLWRIAKKPAQPQLAVEARSESVPIKLQMLLQQHF